MAILLAALLASAAAFAETPAASEAAPWIVGIARFKGKALSIEALSLGDVIPRLMAAELTALPPRLQAGSEAAEAAVLAAELVRFSAGAELYARLDDRALRFLDPALAREARRLELGKAAQKVADAALRLEQATSGEGAADVEGGASVRQDLPSRSAALWEGHSRGELLDEPRPSPAQAAKAKKLDLLVYGSVEEVAEYALVRVTGYDASVDRTVFSWKGFCSPEDPAPLAVDFARRLEGWIAGREFARLDIDVEPPSSVVLADGKRLDGENLVLYRFEAAKVRIEAAAAGYAAAELEASLVPGERNTIAVKLEPSVRGSATISTDAPNASILVDSVLAGTTPIAVTLSGKREIVTAYSPGRERAVVVLPASGEARVELELRLDDGLGVGGRVAMAKDRFYQSFGWFLSSATLSSLALGVSSLYSEAALRSGDAGLAAASMASTITAGTAIAASAVLALNSIIRLTRYVGTAR